jgi:hypothetical protein
MAETFKQTVDRTKFFNIGGSDDPDATGPENYEHMLRARKAAVHYDHVATLAGFRYITYAERAIEIVGAVLRAENGWGAGPAGASEVIELFWDDNAGGAKTVIATIDGNTAAGSLTGDESKAFPDLPGVTAAGPFVVVPEGSEVGIELSTNGAGFTMDAVKVEIFYRFV